MIKILVEVSVPIIEEKYDIFIPNNKSIKTIIKLLEDSITELSDNAYQKSPSTLIYDKNGIPYNLNISVKDAKITNGSKLILY